jgi:structure-specific endonuclease subunit SLX1
MEPFAGCYLLRSRNPSFKNHCYVGFTVDPPHRLKQHNGEILGGAFKTHTKRPWDMTLVVFGFPTRKLALRFEWSWQHPTEAKQLKTIDWIPIFQNLDGPRKYLSHLRILKEMLNVKPWIRLSLRVCATSSDVLELLRTPPIISANHQLFLGKLEELPITEEVVPTPGKRVPPRCVLCAYADEPPPEPANWVICPFCDAFLHLRCAAIQFIAQNEHAGTALIPTDGFCPACHENLVWRNLIEIRNRVESGQPDEEMLALACPPLSD